MLALCTTWYHSIAGKTAFQTSTMAGMVASLQQSATSSFYQKLDGDSSEPRGCKELIGQQQFSVDQKTLKVIDHLPVNAQLTKFLESVTLRIEHGPKLLVNFQ